MPTQNPVLSKMVSFRQPVYIQELMEKRVRPNEKTKFYNDATVEKLARTPLLSEQEINKKCEHLNISNILNDQNILIKVCSECGTIR